MSPSDKLTIDTPEQIPLEFPLAGIGSRFLALALDSLIQTFAYLILWLLFAWFEPDLSKIWPKATTWAFAILIIIGFILYAGYFAVFETIWNGQTPGKRAVRIRVIKDSGRPIAVYEAIARNVIRLVDQFPSIYAVGLISVFLSSRNKRLGDYVAGTVVVHESALTELQPAWQAEKTDAAAPVNVSSISLSDLELIETFLQRRYDLALDIRERTAEQIAGRMRQKLQIAADGTSDENFLEKLARDRRDIAGYSH